MARLYTGCNKQKTAGESEGKHMCHGYLRERKENAGIQNIFFIFRSPGMLSQVLLIIKFNQMHFKRDSLMPIGIP